MLFRSAGVHDLLDTGGFVRLTYYPRTNVFCLLYTSSRGARGDASFPAAAAFEAVRAGQRYDQHQSRRDDARERHRRPGRRERLRLASRAHRRGDGRLEREQMCIRDRCSATDKLRMVYARCSATDKLRMVSMSGSSSRAAHLLL